MRRSTALGPPWLVALIDRFQCPLDCTGEARSAGATWLTIPELATG